jgi:5-hydroxyisourate hydrolase-like protein (transthyretin family)
MKNLLKRLLVFIYGSLLFLGCSGGIDTTPVENKIISVRLVNSQWQEKTEITSVSSGRLIATLKNSAGKPLSGEIVIFSTTLGYLRPETATAITDSNGEAAIALLAGSASGAGEAKAVFGEYSASLKFTVADVVDVNIALRLVKAEGNASGEETNKISAASPGRLEAVLSYGKDMPIAGQTLRFTTTLGYIQPTSGTAVTDSSGKASVDLLAGLEPGEGQVTVKFGDYSVPLKFSVTGYDIYLSLYLIKRETYEADSEKAATWETTNTVSKNSAECLVATLRYNTSSLVFPVHFLNHICYSQF